MPAYNAEKYIETSIKSVIGQTYSNWELIIVDDGSTDRTALIIKEIQLIDKRIQYYYQDNGKQGKARNLGLKKSNGDYIAFLDADDLWTKDRLSAQMYVLNQNSHIDLIFSQGYLLNDTEVSNMDVIVKNCWNRSDLNTFISCNQIPVLSVLIKKKALDEANGFSELRQIQNAEDYHLWMSLLCLNKQFMSLSNRLFYYRIHPEQTTFNNQNLKDPLFSSYIDIFYRYNKIDIQKPIIDKIKWLVFDNTYYSQTVDVIVQYSKNVNHWLLTPVINITSRIKYLVFRRLLIKLLSALNRNYV
ncbi:glycosyl transferase family 2 [Mucilaginibacter yixingensis]|uniref:Glycosyl transferase family 2 n=2 Tax=Mucilaginibacter yixingensis TaxID=1295612 RepID=A0A2T5JFU6_9SPHI|nr:glycosyl transferase family 2 [Mucilaginibacter yixingensis]